MAIGTSPGSIPAFGGSVRTTVRVRGRCARSRPGRVSLGDARTMTDSPALPSHHELVDDLRLVRARGLVQLRHLTLPALQQTAGLLGTDPASPVPVESLIRDAVARIEAGKLADAAAYTFGLARGTRDWSAHDRRRRAARAYGVTAEYFRRGHERTVLEQVAECILELSSGVPRPYAGAMARGAALSPVELLPAGADLPPVTLHIGPIELVAGIDILVSSENIHFEMAKTYGASVSAALRRAGAERNATGEIVDDVIERNLTDWMAAHGRKGLPVAPGTIADTAPGRLALNGVKRIYHAAVAVPRPGTHAYAVQPEVIPLAVHNVLMLAERQRDRFNPPLQSLCFPLFGAGRACLDPVVSITSLWRALVVESASSPRWHLHIATSSTRHADVIVATVRGGASRC